MKVFLLDNTFKVLIKDDVVLWNKRNTYKKKPMLKNEKSIITKLLDGAYVDEHELKKSNVREDEISRYPFVMSSEYYTKYINTKFDRTFLFMRSIFGVDADFIDNLKKIKVLIIGLGGVGCSVLNHLIRMGISDYQVIEFDKVDESNLNRQTIYTPRDIGANKTDIIERYILENGGTSVIKHNFKLTKTEELVSIINSHHCDMIINCADYPLYDIDYTVLKAAESCGCGYATAKVGIKKGRWAIFDNYQALKKEAERNYVMSKGIGNQTPIKSSLGIWNDLVTDCLSLDLFFYFNNGFKYIKAYNKYREIWLNDKIK